MLNRGIYEDEQIMNAVKVNSLNLRWLLRADKDFLDLVQILKDTKNAAIL